MISIATSCPCAAQQRCNMIRLPQRKLRAARANADQRRVASSGIGLRRSGLLCRKQALPLASSPLASLRGALAAAVHSARISAAPPRATVNRHPALPSSSPAAAYAETCSSARASAPPPPALLRRKRLQLALHAPATPPAAALPSTAAATRSPAPRSASAGRSAKRSTSACTIASACIASRAAIAHVRRRHRLQIVDVVEKAPSSRFTSGSTSRGTAISMKNIGPIRRRCRNCCACSRRKMGCAAPGRRNKDVRLVAHARADLQSGPPAH